MDWAAHLKHLQTVFQKFDGDTVISELVCIRLFCNGLRPSIRAQAKQESRQKDIWDQVMKKAIMTEAKAALNLLLCVRKMDACCPQGHRSTSKPTEDYTRDQGSLLFHLQVAQTMPPYRFKQAKTSKRPR